MSYALAGLIFFCGVIVGIVIISIFSVGARGDRDAERRTETKGEAS